MPEDLSLHDFWVYILLSRIYTIQDAKKIKIRHSNWWGVILVVIYNCLNKKKLPISFNWIEVTIDCNDRTIYKVTTQNPQSKIYEVKFHMDVPITQLISYFQLLIYNLNNFCCSSYKYGKLVGISNYFCYFSIYVERFWYSSRT